MAKKSNKGQQVKRKLQRDGYWFTQAEAASLVKRAKDVGFTAMPRLVSEKKFDKSKVQDSITFQHDKTKNTITVYKYEIKLNGLNIMSPITDILFTILFEQIEIQSYAVNYEP